MTKLILIKGWASGGSADTGGPVSLLKRWEGARRFEIVRDGREPEETAAVSRCAGLGDRGRNWELFGSVLTRVLARHVERASRLES